MSFFLLTSRDRRPRLSAFNHSLIRPPYSNSLFFIVLSYIFWNWRNAFFDTTKRPLYPQETPSLLSRNALFALKKRLLCPQGTPSLLSRNALFALKMCLLCYHETPFLHWFNSFFSSSFPPLPCYLVPPNGDRRSWMETSPSLPQGEEYLTVTCLNVSFYPKGCHKVGTDALVWKPLPASPKGRST